MGFQVRILAAMAFAAAGGCDPRSSRDEARAPLPSPAQEEVASSLRPKPPARAPEAGNEKPEVEIAGLDGGRKVLRTAAPSLLPLARILQIARDKVPGEVIDVELEDEDGTPEYEVTILTLDSRSIEMKIDARSGIIRKLEED